MTKHIDFTHITALTRPVTQAEAREMVEIIYAQANAEALAHLAGAKRARTARKRATRLPEVHTDPATGEFYLRVPLKDDRSIFALVDLDDWLDLIGCGATGVWFTNKANTDKPYVKTYLPLGDHAATRQMAVARLIVDAESSQAVRTSHSCPLDLRRDALSVEKNRRAKRSKGQYGSARDLVRQAAAKRRDHAAAKAAE